MKKSFFPGQPVMLTRQKWPGGMRTDKVTFLRWEGRDEEYPLIQFQDGTLLMLHSAKHLRG
jgi:hypothetical protein